MEIIELQKSNIFEIESLWNELNTLHHVNSSNFQNHFESFTFQERVNQLLKKEQLSIFVAMIKNEKVGYCIATKDNDSCEVDSLYVQLDYRKQKIGNELMKKALDWLENLKCATLKVSVADGNESVLPFYEKYGFKKRFTIMQMT